MKIRQPLFGFSALIIRGDGLRARSGGKNCKPNRSFSRKTGLPRICSLRKKAVGYPTPAIRRISSTKPKHRHGKTTAATSRKVHFRVGESPAGVEPGRGFRPK